MTKLHIQTAAAYFCLLLPPLLWAGNFIIGRAATEIDPFTLNLLRWIVAGLCLLPVLLWHFRSAMRALRSRYLVIISLTALGIIGFNTVLYAGLKSTPAGAAGVLFGVTPLLILALSRLWLRHPLTFFSGLGGILAFCGLVFVLSGGLSMAGFEWRGAALVGVSAMIFAAYTVTLQHAALELRGEVCLALTIWLGLLVMAPFAALRPDSWLTLHEATQVLPAVLYLGVGASVLAFFAWQSGVRVLGAQKAGVFLQLVPVFGVVLGWLILDESLAQGKLVGLLCIICGVVIAQVPGKTRNAAKASADRDDDLPRFVLDERYLTARRAKVAVNCIPARDASGVPVARV